MAYNQDKNKKIEARSQVMQIVKQADKDFKIAIVCIFMKEKNFQKFMKEWRQSTKMEIYFKRNYFKTGLYFLLIPRTEKIRYLK